MEQTRGYFRLEGKIWGLNNKSSFENSVKRSLSFGIQSSKTNSNYVQVGDWKNSKLNVKIKSESDGEVLELGEQEAIDYIKENFNDGDSVYLNIRADVDTFHKKLNWIISQIYKKSEDINFESDDFEEVNELKTSIIVIEKPTDKVLKGGMTTYKGEMIELNLSLEDDIIDEYMQENAKVGDLIPVTIKVDNRPQYEEGSGSSSKERKTLKGKVIGGDNNKTYKHIKGRELFLVITDVDVEKVESKKYERSEIREALESANVQNNNKGNNDDVQIIDDSDLPY